MIFHHLITGILVKPTRTGVQGSLILAGGVVSRLAGLLDYVTPLPAITSPSSSLEYRLAAEKEGTQVAVQEGAEA